jgi:chemotaxis regulatin CheY-phosphate phosphatase CheZ
MRVGEINDMLHKTEELKALFVFGQRVIPFLEEIFLFIREVTPLLENINTSIEENLSKMPKASQQLSNVTRATELATTEILDTLDGLSYKADVISSNLKQLLAVQRQNAQEYEKIVAAVGRLQLDETTPTDQKDSIYARLTDAIRKVESRDGGSSSNFYVETIKSAVSTLQPVKADQPQVSEELVANSDKLLESIRMDSTQIMMSLQVQDITSQQLAAVNSLLQTVQSRLSEILIHFRNTEIGELISVATATRPSKEHAVADDTATHVATMHRTIAYDHDVGSALIDDPERQNRVDDIMSGFINGGAPSDNAGQDDIDALFGATPPTPPSPPPSGAGGGTEASQNDVDVLFDSGGGSGAPSQDDIDALFANQ